MPVFIHMLQRMSPEMAYRDILQRHAISVAKGDMRTSTGGRLLQRATLDPKRASDSGAVAIATIKSVPLGKVRECRRKGQCVYLFVSLDWLWHGWSCRPRKLIVGASLGSSRTPDLTELVRGSM